MYGFLTNKYESQTDISLSKTMTPIRLIPPFDGQAGTLLVRGAVDSDRWIDYGSGCVCTISNNFPGGASAIRKRNALTIISQKLMPDAFALLRLDEHETMQDQVLIWENSDEARWSDSLKFTSPEIRSWIREGRILFSHTLPDHPTFAIMCVPLWDQGCSNFPAQEDKKSYSSPLRTLLSVPNNDRIQDVTQFKTELTGVVIDTRGLTIQPALFPKIIGPEGKQLYGVEHVIPKWAAAFGVAGYFTKIDAIKKMVGKKPLFFNAVEVINSTNIRLNTQAASSIKTEAVLRLLAKSRMAILVDNPGSK